MENNKLKEGKDYFLSFSFQEFPISAWTQVVEIKVCNSDCTYTTIYVYIVKTLNKSDISQLCSDVVQLYFPNTKEYDIHVNKMQYEK